jgi:hypothetical protein
MARTAAWHWPHTAPAPTIALASRRKQWWMQDENQGGAKTMEMLICMKI